MWIPLPDGLVEFLNLLGFDWPLADEEKLWECGDEWGKFSTTLRDLTKQAESAVNNVVAENSDDSIKAFEERWKKFTEDPGYLTRGAEAADTIQGVFYAASIIVIALKIAVIVQLIYLAYVWATAIAAAVETLGASIAAAAGTTVAVRLVVKGLFKLALKGLKELGEKYVKDARKKLDDAIKRIRKNKGDKPGNGKPPRNGKPKPQTRQDAEDILDEGATTEKTKKSTIKSKPGGKEQAEQDFEELTEGLEVKTAPNGSKVAQLPDGSYVTLRKSSDGRITISMQTKGQPDTKYRYDE